MRRYYIHLRKGVWYAILLDPLTGKRLPARSTFQTNRDEALHTVHNWLRDGLPDKKTAKPTRPVAEVFNLARVLESLKHESLSPDDVQRMVDILTSRGMLASATLTGSPGAELFTDFLTRFWTFKESPYAKEKTAHGQRIGEVHCDHNLLKVKKDWASFFAGKRLADVARDDIKRFSIHLARPERKLSPGSLNSTLVAGTTALRWAHENGLIPTDPTAGVMRYSGETKRRGILTHEEASALFALDWPDERLYLANWLAATTGLRAGEVAALRLENLDGNLMTVEASYLEGHGLKSTKTGKVRQVPVISALADRLKALAAMNPHGNGYVFWETYREDSPMEGRLFGLALREMLALLKTGPGATEEQTAEAIAYWNGRNVVFHSWRHFFSTDLSIAVGPDLARKLTGHATGAVFAGYADHQKAGFLEDMAGVTEKAFGNIVPFKVAQ